MTSYINDHFYCQIISNPIHLPSAIKEDNQRATIIILSMSKPIPERAILSIVINLSRPPQITDLIYYPALTCNMLL